MEEKIRRYAKNPPKSWGIQLPRCKYPGAVTKIRKNPEDLQVKLLANSHRGKIGVACKTEKSGHQLVSASGGKIRIFSATHHQKSGPFDLMLFSSMGGGVRRILQPQPLTHRKAESVHITTKAISTHASGMHHTNLVKNTST